MKTSDHQPHDSTAPTVPTVPADQKAAVGGDASGSVWYAPLSDSGSEHVLFCLPYAGMGNSVFGGWRSANFDSADLFVAQLPGRDARLREPPIDNAPELVTHLADAIMDGPLAQRPLSLLGCSVGGVLAFELARELRNRNRSIERLIVAACRAPHRLRVDLPVAHLPEEEMVEKLRDWYGAIPAEVADNPEVLELVLPAIRADMRVYETYQYTDAEPLTCPILAIGGSDDRIVTVNDLSGWRQHSTAKVTCRQYSGGHFFMKNDAVPVLRFLKRQMG